ncbi:hypothetical protein CSPX01_07634 [Colletotrichum filicis]|nr:hypothetical protein CSPX01_07634 [Colletotrichum filicis]
MKASMQAVKIALESQNPPGFVKWAHVELNPVLPTAPTSPRWSACGTPCSWSYHQEPVSIVGTEPTPELGHGLIPT